MEAFGIKSSVRQRSTEEFANKEEEEENTIGLFDDVYLPK